MGVSYRELLNAILGGLPRQLQDGSWSPETMTLREAWNFQALPLFSGEVRGAGDWVPSNHDYVMKPPWKSLNCEVWRASGLVKHPCAGWLEHPKFHGDRSSCTWHPCRSNAMYLIIWLFFCIPYKFLYNKPVNKSVSLGSWAVMANYQN